MRTMVDRLTNGPVPGQLTIGATRSKLSTASQWLFTWLLSHDGNVEDSGQPELQPPFEHFEADWNTAISEPYTCSASRREANYPEQFLMPLVDRGWGVRAAFRAGFRALQSDADPDLVMTEVWSGDARSLAIDPVALTIGVKDVDERIELLTLARDLHDQGHYAAAVPLLASQTDGIVADAYDNVHGFYGAPGGKALASRLKRDPEDGQFAAIGLRRLIEIYSASKGDAEFPSLARNGILHGWATGYGTRTVSAKYWSVLAHVLHVLHYFPQLSDLFNAGANQRSDIEIGWPGSRWTPGILGN